MTDQGLKRCRKKRIIAAIAILAGLGIKPQHFIARMHLTGNFEWIAAAEEARRRYRRRLEHQQVLSVAMKKLVVAKIDALKKG